MEFSEVKKEIINDLRYVGTNPTLGGDPEFFVADARGVVLNADRFLPGKDDPILVASPHHENRESKMFFDGIQAEIAAAHSNCREYFADNIAECLRIMIDRIPGNHRIILQPSARIQKAIIDNADPEARIFGCMPDFNAYTLCQNTPEMDASNHPFRYAGGHMHFGISSPYYGPDNDEYAIAKTEDGHLRAIKFFDLLVTIPTLLLDNGPGAERRREKYGKAGCFRPTPYGIEYRTPSCWWLRSPMTVSLIYGLGRLAWTMLTKKKDEDIRKAIGCTEDEIRGAIDEADFKTVKRIWENLRPYISLAGVPFGNPLCIASVRTTKASSVKDHYTGMAGKLPTLDGVPVFGLAAFEYALANGIDSVVVNDFKEEWGLNEDRMYKSGNGWINGCFKNLVNNKDFIKFQASFLKSVFPKTNAPYVLDPLS